ncbi:MAG TPA: ADP-ribosylglycohydrolase family protein [Rectinemataceae bacterium]|nr:ADP-ribosylglycohydrolase family protein [Rectinemataceae bacterium]
MSGNEEIERVAGGLVGLAVGDALGVPVEFAPRSERDADPVVGMRSGGAWAEEAGTWSDDTSLALCLAESIVERGFDPEDFGRRALAWLREGRWSARGGAFGVGGATRRSLEKIGSGMPAIRAGGRGENDNGNGSLMRSLPAAIWLAASPEPLRLRALAAYSAVTHGHPRSLLGVWLHALVAAGLLRGQGPAEAYAAGMAEARNLLPTLPASFRIESRAYERVLGGGLAGLPRRDLRGSGYVVHCLEASLWCLATTDSFSSCVLAAVNLGEDSDTTGAVAGGLAGLAYGMDAIPPEWRGVLARRDEIEALAAQLAAAVSARPPFAGSYWILPGRLLAGPHPLAVPEAESRARVEALREAGIEVVVDLTDDGEKFPVDAAAYEALLGGGGSSGGGSSAGGGSSRGGGASGARSEKGRIERRRAPLRDFGAEAAGVRRAVGQVEAALESGCRVYLHCRGGVGRTGMVAAACLVERGLAAPSEALGLLAALRAAAGESRPSPETPEQRELVAAWRPGPAALPL